MSAPSSLAALFALASLATAQLGPVVGARGVVNAFTQEPAPSSVAPGGLIWINGLNFGSADNTKVLVNGATARLLSMSPMRILAQVPPDTASGLAEVVVQQGDARSRPARFLVQTVVPSVRTAGDTGYGEAATTISGDFVTLAVSGIEREAAVAAHVGGLTSTAEVASRDDRPGELEVKLRFPAGWQSGDVITLRTRNQTANRTTVRSISRPAVSYFRLPPDAPEIRALVGSDLRGNYLIASAAPDSQGCYPSFLFDLAKPSATRLEACLVSGSENDLTPVVAETEGSSLAALLGPVEGQAPAAVSSKVTLFHPERTDPLTIQLPSAATSLLGLGADGITAVLAGEPVRRVTLDPHTGEVREAPGLGGALPPAAGVGLTVDLGDGLNQVLSMSVAGSDGLAGLVVGDNAERPTRMKFAFLSSQGDITSMPFPQDWLALLGPAQPASAGGGHGGVTGPGPGVAAARATVVFHSLSNAFYVLARNSSNSTHGLIAFAKGESAPRLIRFPEGWFAAGCTSRVPVYSFQLSSLLAVPASLTLETESKSPCLAWGLAVVEPGAEVASLVSLPPQAPLNLAGGSTGSMNDFVYGGNAAAPDSLVVFDGATRSVAKLDLPAGAASFSGIVPVASMNVLVSSATRQTQGDAGFVVFDLERSSVRSLAVPDRFSSANLVGVFPVTRKLVVTGTRSDGTGSQLIVYDLMTGDAVVVPNPEGVAWVGSAAQQAATGVPGGPAPGGGFPGGGVPPGGGLPGGTTPVPAPGGAGLQQANVKANTVAAVCFDSGRKQVGVMGVRVP